MGQYYEPILITKDNKIHHFNRDVDGEYTTAKLTEHSWIENTMVDTFCNKILNKKCRVAWVGDYADEYNNEEEKPNNISDEQLKMLVDERKQEGKGMRFRPLNLKYTLLVNHTKKEFIDMYDYIQDNTDKDGWCVHPLPILTAVGNGFGGGDYWGINKDLVGSWALDLIEIVSCDKCNTLTQKGYTSNKYKFTENMEEK